MSNDFERYKAALLRWRDENLRIVDYIMNKAEQDGELTLEEFLELCAIASGED